MAKKRGYLFKSGVIIEVHLFIILSKIYGIGKTLPPAPVETDTAARSEAFVEKPMEVGEPYRVYSDVPAPANQGSLRIESPTEHVGEPSRVFSDVHAPANQGSLRIESPTEHVRVSSTVSDVLELVLREFFSSRKFIGMHTKKLIAGSSSAAPFCKLNWEGYPTCLSHSPQFARKMAIRGGSERVFEIGPVFKEDSISKQLCEYTGVDVY
ncbi:aspartate--tRNA ligase 1, cytoplasmic-like [Papaver somniferum]|uniref:aspartate--tRNA ligase 1, cytoplasmic-like n=1 Tax=Papaver somniferum TaxID=3469 RepID=UPI000E6F4F62|nr:aspartate--tRNA ligase 1, cytoplasmic-like [Papaver somniferum]